jgi:hypothetical protein
MAKFKAELKFIDKVTFIVEADNEEEAINYALSGDGKEIDRDVEDTELISIEEIE